MVEWGSERGREREAGRGSEWVSERGREGEGVNAAWRVRVREFESESSRNGRP